MNKEEIENEKLRNTTSRIMAQAIKRLYPNTRLAIGPTVKNGFYYDIDTDPKLTEQDLKAVEKEMKKIIKSKLPIEKVEMTKAEVRRVMEERGETYKVELIDELPDDAIVKCYKQGDFIDVCNGEFFENTGEVKAFRLQSVAGAYWRGNEKNPMIQRIYGTAFKSREDLEQYLKLIEEAKKRDHKKLGKDLELYTIMGEGPGFPFFLPKGMILRNELEKFWREEHEKRGYQEVKTPIMLDKQLWEQSGHWDHYRENMYTSTIDDKEFALKPMNCPGGMLIYKSQPHSYKELPLRMAELGLVHRHEKSGALNGLFRVRCFTQDDAHIFMTPDQITDEIVGVMDLIDDIYKKFGFKYRVELSTRPENSMGTDEQWEMATNGLIEALKQKETEYELNEGDGAFYGPKIDFHLEDSLGRNWQCGTIQVDFQMPERFDLTYTGEDGQKHRPVMLHRAILGSMERFIGILTEHQAANFSPWIAPVQTRILPISERHIEYSEEVANELQESGIRAELDYSNESFGKKVRDAITKKIPYAVIIGDKELEEKKITVRNKNSATQESMTVEEFTEQLTKEIKDRELEAKIAIPKPANIEEKNIEEDEELER